jgi:prevent-host-death family protein
MVSCSVSVTASSQAAAVFSSVSLRAASRRAISVCYNVFRTLQEVAMYQVTLEEAQGKLAQLVEHASHGEEILITRGNIAVAKLVPAPTQDKPRRKLGTATGLVHIADDFDAPLDDFKEYM